MTPISKKRGRPRVYSSNAARQVAYNRRKQSNERNRLYAEIAKLMSIRSSDRAGLEHQLGIQYPTIRKLKEFLRSLGRKNSVTTQFQENGD